MLGYTHPVRITRGTAGAAEPNSGWGAPGTEAVLFDDVADVQDGAETLDLIAGDAGERVDANALVFFPPSGAAAFASVRIGDSVQTPIGSGTVVRLLHTDAALAVRITRSAPSVPVILS